MPSMPVRGGRPCCRRQLYETRALHWAGDKYTVLSEFLIDCSVRTLQIWFFVASAGGLSYGSCEHDLPGKTLSHDLRMRKQFVQDLGEKLSWSASEPASLCCEGDAEPLPPVRSESAESDRRRAPLKRPLLVSIRRSMSRLSDAGVQRASPAEGCRARIA